MQARGEGLRICRRWRAGESVERGRGVNVEETAGAGMGGEGGVEATEE